MRQVGYTYPAARIGQLAAKGTRNGKTEPAETTVRTTAVTASAIPMARPS